MRRFDPLIHPAPDLVVEVDILSPSVPREPICARLGVSEIWRYNGSRLEVRILGGNKVYTTAVSSHVFPYLPMARFAEFISPMIERDETAVLREFRDWVRSLPQIHH
jgi:Uma2 family endonuclease